MLDLIDDIRLNKIVSTKLKRRLTGTSFLLNPDPLIYGIEDILYKIQYLKIAAKRDYGLYKLYNFRGLDLSYYPDINLKSLHSNPLLVITPTQINFIHEGK